jgi:RNase P/RNase MRP subunit POP5
MVLRRKDKHRYLLLYLNDEISSHFKDTSNKDIKSITIIRRRFSELFGTIALEKASIKVIFENNNLCLPPFLIIKCKLESMDNVLCAIALSYPPLTTIKISGTIKKLTSSVPIET